MASFIYTPKNLLLEPPNVTKESVGVSEVPLNVNVLLLDDMVVEPVPLAIVRVALVLCKARVVVLASVTGPVFEPFCNPLGGATQLVTPVPSVASKYPEPAPAFVGSVIDQVPAVAAVPTVTTPLVAPYIEIVPSVDNPVNRLLFEPNDMLLSVGAIEVPEYVNVAAWDVNTTFPVPVVVSVRLLLPAAAAVNVEVLVSVTGPVLLPFTSATVAGFTQLVTPAPFVVNMYPVRPALVGNVMVHDPAAAAGMTVTAPLVAPDMVIDPFM